jgi:diguanylate cyclase (GGDEF)-like protein
MLDIDDFKHINDTFGHMVGDEVLKGIVGILRTSCREQDVLGRVGGDEFAILVLDCDASHSLNIAQRIHRGLAAIEFKGGDRLFHVSASIGLINQAVRVEGFKELYDKADQALLQAKAAGKSRTVLFPG